jgi:hypothetical protein
VNRPATIVWVVLVLLTLCSYSLGERHAAAWLILGAAGAKFVLVAWSFMELNKAARMWSIALFGLLGVILAAGLLLA